MSAKPPVSVSPEEQKDALATLVDGHRPRTKRIVKVRTEDGLTDCEIVVTRARFALALLPSGKLVTIGKLARRGAK
jgi:hypothetical protein